VGLWQHEYLSGSPYVRAESEESKVLEIGVWRERGEKSPVRFFKIGKIRVG
jgi:hypothetical protein